MDKSPPIGVIMLETRFPRLPGDIGNPETFAGEVIHQRLKGGSVARAVRADGIDAALRDAAVAAARSLDRAGAGVITTSCGFLGALQADLSAAVRAPVIASALVLLPSLRAIFAGRGPIGILTFDSRRLRPVHFAGAFDPADPIAGIEAGDELYPAIAEDRATFDAVRAEADALAAAARLLDRPPRPAAILLECTNLSPYRAALAAASGLPVFDIVQAVAWLRAGRADEATVSRLTDQPARTVPS